MEQNKFMNKIEWVDKREPLSDRQKELLMFVFADSLAPPQQSVSAEEIEEFGELYAENKSSNYIQRVQHFTDFVEGFKKCLEVVIPIKSHPTDDEITNACEEAYNKFGRNGDVCNGFTAGIQFGLKYNQPIKFTPERTPKEEAERLAMKPLPIMWYNEVIEALKSANVSTVWHEEVLTILKGM